MMNGKITSDHLGRSAVVYVRQSTMSQVMGNLESQRRQYDLAGAAQKAGFIGVTVIDEDLGRSGSGSTHRPGFERLVAMGGEGVSLTELMRRADIVIATTGVKGLIKSEWVRPGQVILALSNPDPEIERLASSYLAFLWYAFDANTSRFRTSLASPRGHRPQW